MCTVTVFKVLCTAKWISPARKWRRSAEDDAGTVVRSGKSWAVVHLLGEASELLEDRGELVGAGRGGETECRGGQLIPACVWVLPPGVRRTQGRPWQSKSRRRTAGGVARLGVGGGRLPGGDAGGEWRRRDGPRRPGSGEEDLEPAGLVLGAAAATAAKVSAAAA